MDLRLSSDTAGKLHSRRPVIGEMHRAGLADHWMTYRSGLVMSHRMRGGGYRGPEWLQGRLQPNRRRVWDRTGASRGCTA